MWKKSWLVSTLLTTILWSGEWSYKVTSGLMGKVGSFTVSKKQDDQSYRIDAQAITRGVTAVLTGDRKEYYRSEGVVQNGRLKARTFQIRRVMKKKKQIDTYRIDPAAKKVIKRKQRWKKGKKPKDRRTGASRFPISPKTTWPPSTPTRSR